MTRFALVTGGSGFVGGHLTERLIENGWSVRVLDIVEPSLDAEVEWIDADVRDADAVRAGARDCDTIFHLGAVVGVRPLLEDPIQTIDVTVNGTRNALEAAAAHGASLIHLSSSEALGINPDLPWAEDTNRMIGSALVDRWSYAAAKATAEHVVLAGANSRNVRATVIRPFNVYGPRQRSRFVVPIMVDAALAGDPIPVNDGGTQTRCFTYITDVVDAVMCAGEKPGVGRLLHVGSTDEISILELARRIDEMVGGDAGIAHHSPSDQFGDGYQDIVRRVPDPSLARAVLGWSATTPLDDGLRRTIDWARDQLN